MVVMRLATVSVVPAVPNVKDCDALGPTTVIVPGRDGGSGGQERRRVAANNLGGNIGELPALSINRGLAADNQVSLGIQRCLEAVLLAYHRGLSGGLEAQIGIGCLVHLDQGARHDAIDLQLVLGVEIGPDTGRNIVGFISTRSVNGVNDILNGRRRGSH